MKVHRLGLVVVFLSFLLTLSSLTVQAELLSAFNVPKNPAIDFFGLLELSSDLQIDPRDAERDDEKVSLGTLELGMHSDVSNVIAVDVLIAYQEDSAAMVLDTLTTAYTHSARPKWHAAGGKNYLPFGAFSTFQLNDTLGLELAETNQIFANVGFHGDQFISDVYVYENEEGIVGKVGGRVGYHTDVFHIGFDYIDSLYESPAYGMHGQWTVEQLTLLAEHIVVDHYRLNEKSYAEQYEIAYDFNGIVIAVSYQINDALKILELPQEKASITISAPINHISQAGIELWKQDGIASIGAQFSLIL